MPKEEQDLEISVNLGRDFGERFKGFRRYFKSRVFSGLNLIKQKRMERENLLLRDEEIYH